ncbi:MAG: class I SAM-dependent methyltransferase [Deltaproteobacteria bacterium]|nr:MAG: hypothetical protein DME76_17130 [Verrucomicrobiota bacterium]TLY36487.1 MAG: class I SAM-dependent methyltransferase [Nitrospirota bacterium]TMB74785.1 MAG: class I SAM-dependent methyltransferase [Deltaproteobacteria bacterium]
MESREPNTNLPLGSIIDGASRRQTVEKTTGRESGSKRRPLMKSERDDDSQSSVGKPLLPRTATCPLCGRSGASQLFLNYDRVHRLPGIFGLYRCGGCDAIFIQPWLSEAELARYYPEQYGRFRHSRSLNEKTYTGWQRFVLENYYGYPAPTDHHSSSLKKVVAHLLSFITAKAVIPYRGTGRILDVGCGGGSYLHRLKQWGWDACGVEPSQIGTKQAQSLGLTVRHGMLADARFESEFFDVVRLSNVLEHIRDPIPTFQEIQRILKSDGLVYLTVPNTRSLVFWLFQENWYALETPRHVISYCPRTLEALCRATGFEIARLTFASGPFNFVRSVRYFFEERGKHWPNWLRRIRWDQSKFIRRVLKPCFLIIDGSGYGDFLHATLRKKTARDY